MAYHPEFQYRVIPSQRLKTRQRDAIRNLAARSITVDYPERSSKGLNYFLAHNAVGNPNRGVGGPLLRAGQAYARALYVLAIRDDEPIISLPMADNASSRKPGLAGAAEIQAKLYVPELAGKQLIEHRYAWLGYAALAPELHQEIVEEEAQPVNPLDVAAYLGLKSRDERQPVTSYPWDEEEAVKLWLPSVGINVQPGQDSHVKPFGPDAEPVYQERSVGESVKRVNELILAKEGAEKAIHGLVRAK